MVTLRQPLLTLNVSPTWVSSSKYATEHQYSGAGWLDNRPPDTPPATSPPGLPPTIHNLSSSMCFYPVRFLFDLLTVRSGMEMSMLLGWLHALSVGEGIVATPLWCAAVVRIGDRSHSETVLMLLQVHWWNRRALTATGCKRIVIVHCSEATIAMENQEGLELT